ncbi:MAG: alpha/beta hydrolase family protein, partial [Actinomycetota bacterium]
MGIVRLRRRRFAAAFLVVAIALLSPPFRSRVKAVLLVLEVLPSSVRPLSVITPEPRRTDVSLAGGPADLYRPRGFSNPPGVVLIHGANPEGKDDPRVRSLAAALSRTGRRVLVPQFELRHGRLDLEDLRLCRQAVSFLGRDVGVLAFSYGGGLALVALAEEPEVQERVAFVATVGTYFDLAHIIQGVTTGTVPYRGRDLPWRTATNARDQAAEQLAAFIEDRPGEALGRAWRSSNPDLLDPETRAIYDLLANEDPARVRSLLRALPDDLLGLIERISPSSWTDRIHAPVYALHASTDPAAPPTESLLLVEALAPRVEARFYEVDFLE